MAANIIRDTLATWINTDIGFVPVVDTIRGGAMELKQGQTARRYATVAVPFHIARNRDYLGRPIVPDHLRGTVDPERQFNSYTSDLGKIIGQTFTRILIGADTVK